MDRPSAEKAHDHRGRFCRERPGGEWVTGIRCLACDPMPNAENDARPPMTDAASVGGGLPGSWSDAPNAENDAHEFRPTVPPYGWCSCGKSLKQSQHREHVADAAREQLAALARGDWEAADAAGRRIIPPGK